MAIVGIYITDEFEKYYLNSAYTTITTNIWKNQIEKIIKADDFDNVNILQSKMRSISVPDGYEILAIDQKTFKILASTKEYSEFLNKNALNTREIDEVLILKADAGVISQGEKKIISQSNYKIKNIAIPYVDTNKKVVGIVYGRANLENIYKILSNSKIIFIKATLIALLITVILGFLIAKSITTPINDVTKKASKMARGDFNQRVDIKSDDEIGKLGEMFNYLTDKLKYTLLEISGERSKLNAIINQMADGIIAVNTEGEIIHVNPTFLKMMNIEDKNIQGKNYDDIITRYNDKLTLKYLKDKKTFMGSETVKIENGNTFRANYVYLKNEDEEVRGLLLVLQDITEHEKLDNMRKEFVANVSHELKTPITTVKSYTETLIDGAIDDKETAIEFLNVINQESDRMARLVRDLLQLSHLEYKKLDFKFVKFDINILIRDILKKLDISFKEKNHIIDISISDKVVMINGDRDKIEQVLQNILSNAIKYTPEGGKIVVDAEYKKDKVIINISDNGLGIPEEDLPRIFERFYRVDKARSRDMGGTGLGLSIAKHIVEEHGGAISVQSTVGGGSTFTISLPVDIHVDM